MEYLVGLFRVTPNAEILRCHLTAHVWNLCTEARNCQQENSEKMWTRGLEALMQCRCPSPHTGLWV